MSASHPPTATPGLPQLFASLPQSGREEWLLAVRSSAHLPPLLATWSVQRRQHVLGLARQRALELAETELQRALLATALETQRAPLCQAVLPELVFLPLLVYAAIRGDDEPAVPLSAATVLLGLGVDLFDDLADGDLPAHWAEYRTAEISLLAATLMCAIPQLVLAGLDAPAERRAALLRAVAECLLHMSAGQHDDIRFARSERVTAREVEASMAAKSGVPLLTSLPSHLAGATRPVLDAYARMGQALGAATQLADDCLDLFVDPHSRDLASGTRTLPLAAYLERQPDIKRRRFVELLDAARTDPQAQADVRQRLLEDGAWRRCMFSLEVYRHRARRALEAANPREPARSCLIRIIDHAALAPTVGPGPGSRCVESAEAGV